MNYADYVMKTLKGQGVKHIFMLSGGGCMHLCDALGRSGIDYTCCLHEQAAIIAATAYAQYTNTLGVALVTSGPGATNAVTGVMGAWSESVPVLVLSGQVKIQDIGAIVGLRTKGVQEAPIKDIISPITKYATTITNPQYARYALEKAVLLAMSGRKGPVWLDVPLDIQSMVLDFDALCGYECDSPVSRVIARDKMQQVDALLRNAERPVILAGYGIRAADAIQAFLKFADLAKIPILTTWKASDILADDHPLYMGRPGIAGQRAANFVMQNADVLLCIGARLDFPQIGYEHSLFAREAKKIIVDVDSAELTKWGFHVDVPICADALDFINSLLVLPDLEAFFKNGWVEQCVRWNACYPLVPDDQYKKKDFTGLYAFIEALSSRLTAHDVIVPGSSGMGSDVSYQVTKIKTGQRLFNCPGLGSMGFGIPSALGACIASGRRPTICVNGDGGFQMNIQELETIARVALPIKFFVINNEGYGSIRHTQRNYFDGRYVGSSEDSGVSLPDVKAIGNAYGLRTFQIKTNSDLESVIPLVLASHEPVICEVLVDPKDTLAFKATSTLRPDGSAVTAPIEDLFPLLPRKEFYGNMYIKPVNATGINLCNILFDLDGTLVDSSVGISASVAYAMRKMGYPVLPQEKINDSIGLPLMRMMKFLMPDLEQHELEALSKAYREHYTKEGVYNASIYKGIKDMLHALLTDFDLYIVTSKPEQLAKEIAKTTGIAHYFKDIRGVGIDLSSKSKETLIKELLDDHSLIPSKTIMVGDREEDINAAAANVIKTIAVQYGYGNDAELEGALIKVDSVNALRHVLY